MKTPSRARGEAALEGVNLAGAMSRAPFLESPLLILGYLEIDVCSEQGVTVFEPNRNRHLNNNGGFIAALKTVVGSPSGRTVNEELDLTEDALRKAWYVLARVDNAVPPPLD